jgi:hypothetical protein
MSVQVQTQRHPSPYPDPTAQITLFPRHIAYSPW